MAHTTLGVSQIRAEQLREIARAQRVEIAFLIDGLVRGAWASLGRDTLPGYPLHADRDDETGEPRVIFGPNGIEPIILTPAQAREIADGLNGLANGETRSFHVETACDGFRSAIRGAVRGRGFHVQVIDNLDRSNPPLLISGLNWSLVQDLAGSFEVYARKAEALQ